MVNIKSSMKYVLIGTGNISNTYVRAFSELPQSEIVACVSRSKKSPKAAPYLPSWADLKSVEKDFGAVIVCSPNGRHCPDIISAASLSKHVLTEKPLGINSTDMEQAIQACEMAGVKLGVAYQRRTSPDNQAVRNLLDQGALGRVFAADLSAKFYRDQAYYDSAGYRGGYEIDGGGPFIQQACHNIDLYLWFFGMPSKVVSMMDTFTHQMEAEDHGAALLRHPNGMIGTIIASSSAKPGFAARLEVHTEKGSFTMTDDAITEWYFEDIPNPASSDFAYAHDGAKSASVSDVSAHKKVILDFEKAIAENRPPLADGPGAKATSELILEIYRSNFR